MSPVDAALKAHAHARRELRKRDRERSEFQRLGKPWPARLMREYRAWADQHLAALRKYERLAGKPPPGEEDGTDEHPSETRKSAC
jgi:hypothetical protein